ncbi:MAG: hypothetical protein J0M15_09435 [Deltaproteobacteria bacterium]|jgi:hypothetical protein|nr:hypothetical protein [Deltaproteobacteria bacterium]
MKHFFNKELIFYIVVFSWMQNAVFAQETLIERSYTISSEKESLIEAKKEIMEKAVQSAVEDISRDIIGEERLTKNKTIFQTRVVSKASKFIPFSKVTEPEVLDKKTTQTIFLKVSLQELKNILKENRILEEIDQKLNILPLVHFENMLSGKKYRWWSKQDEGWKKISLSFESQLQKNLLKSGIFLQRPTFFEFQNSMPTIMAGEKWAMEDLIYLGKWYQSPFILEGSVSVKNTNKKSIQNVLFMKLTLIQAQQGKVVLDIQRQYDLPVFKEDHKLETWIETKIAEEVDSISLDLSQQLDEILQRGILNTQKIRLQFKMTSRPLRIENIKEKMKAFSSLIKNMREREITSQFVVYEVDFSGSVQELQNKILSSDFSFGELTKISLLKTNEKEMIFEIK